MSQSNLVGLVVVVILLSVVSLIESLPINEDDSQCQPVFYPEGCFTDEIQFRRVSFKNNLRKETSIYLRGYSKESILIHTLLVFSDDIHHYHNTLLLNPRMMEKYEKILHNSAFPFNNEFILVTKGREILLQFDVAPFHSPYLNGTISYDAVLILDYYSSLWNEYNSWIIERSRLILKKVEPPWKAKDDSREDFRGLYHLWCNRSHSLKKCHVELPEKIHINHRTYHSYGLVLDPMRSDNLLPQELFIRWMYHNEKELFIRKGEDEILHLNSQLHYGVNEETQDIILGIDFIHYFQKVEYNLEAGYYKLFYTHIYHAHDSFEFQRLVITVFIGTILFGILLFWITSPNYDILQTLLERKEYFLFPLRIVSCEVLSICIAIILWIMTGIFSESVDDSTFHHSHSDHKKRSILFILFSVYHVLFNIIFLFWNWSLTKATYRYYYAYTLYLSSATKTDSDYADLVRMVNIEEGKISPRYVIQRNILLHTIAATNLLLILNYLSEEMLIYFMILVVVSLTIVYYYTKMLLVSLFYLSLKGTDWRNAFTNQYSNFLFLFLLNLIVYCLFIGFSIPTTYFSFLNEINSMYSDIMLWSFTLLTLTFIMIVAVYVVFYVVIKYQRITSPPQEKKKM